jgi:hypothetical protein
MVTKKPSESWEDHPVSSPRKTEQLFQQGHLLHLLIQPTDDTQEVHP